MLTNIPRLVQRARAEIYFLSLLSLQSGLTAAFSTKNNTFLILVAICPAHSLPIVHCCSYGQSLPIMWITWPLQRNIAAGFFLVHHWQHML
ncbi:hypothetical protein F4604DRAFT_1284957 [Suillus subluteus]|nr:hypothetical protein F4604DRAFT_1284957 [Suillus subluteus]